MQIIWILLDRGIYIAPSQFETMFISNAHTEEDIEKHVNLQERLYAVWISRN